MRVTLDKLMEKLGVPHTLAPYEAHPWFHYDEEKGLSCSAEVRRGPAGEDVEAEIQMLKDPVDDEEEGGDEEGSSDMPKQILRMRILPVRGHPEWTPTELMVKGENFVNKIYNWEEKGCDFFRNCIQAIQMGEMPEIDDLITKDLNDDESKGGGRRGRVGRKSPKVKPGALMGMNKKM